MKNTSRDELMEEYVRLLSNAGESSQGREAYQSSGETEWAPAQEEPIMEEWVEKIVSH